MFDRPQTRLRWWLVGLVVVVAAVLLANAGPLAPVRDLVSRLTLPIQRTLSQAGSSIRQFTGTVDDLASLRARNAELEEAVANLTVDNLRLREVEAENARLRRLLDFVEEQPSFAYKGGQVLGRVVANEPNNTIQSITIDLGRKDGMHPGMPVVTERGLVGRITEVYNSASRVLLITDSNSSVNVVLQNGRLRGILRGRASQPTLLDYLPQNQPLTVGDIVLTSGEGGNFPKGIPVGQVVEIEQNDVEMFQRAIVRTTVDFNTLETVLVITSFAPVEDLDNLPEG